MSRLARLALLLALAAMLAAAPAAFAAAPARGEADPAGAQGWLVRLLHPLTRLFAASAGDEGSGSDPNGFSEGSEGTNNTETGEGDFGPGSDPNG